jgi:hypothetical protein
MMPKRPRVAPVEADNKSRLVSKRLFQADPGTLSYRSCVEQIFGFYRAKPPWDDVRTAADAVDCGSGCRRDAGETTMLSRRTARTPRHRDGASDPRRSRAGIRAG